MIFLLGVNCTRLHSTPLLQALFEIRNQPNILSESFRLQKEEEEFPRSSTDILVLRSWDWLLVRDQAHPGRILEQEAYIDANKAPYIHFPEGICISQQQALPDAHPSDD